jgi:hypothetical protein
MAASSAKAKASKGSTPPAQPTMDLSKLSVQESRVVEGDVAVWLGERVKEEMQRLNGLGQKCIPVPISALAVVRETLVTDPPHTQEPAQPTQPAAPAGSKGAKRAAKKGQQGAAPAPSPAAAPTPAESTSNESNDEKDGEAAAAEDEGPILWNHVEFKTAFDFARVKQLLLGPAMACPIKEGHSAVLAVLLTDSPMPLLFAYIFPENRENTLQNWVFVNSAQDRVRFRIDAFV